MVAYAPCGYCFELIGRSFERRRPSGRFVSAECMRHSRDSSMAVPERWRLGVERPGSYQSTTKPVQAFLKLSKRPGPVGWGHEAAPGAASIHPLSKSRPRFLARRRGQCGVCRRGSFGSVVLGKYRRTT